MVRACTLGGFMQGATSSRALLAACERLGLDAGAMLKSAMKIPNPPGKALGADEYLFGRQIPNFYFHVTTAYDLLRHGGVELSKRDYLGPLNLVDA